MNEHRTQKGISLIGEGQSFLALAIQSFDTAATELAIASSTAPTPEKKSTLLLASEQSESLQRMAEHVKDASNGIDLDELVILANYGKEAVTA